VWIIIGDIFFPGGASLIHHLKHTVATLTRTFPEILLYYVVILTVTGSIYSYFEDKPLWDSFWWACVTGLTIGYGDLYPITVGGRIDALFLMHIVPLVIIPLIITRLLTTVVEDKNVFTHEKQEQLEQDIIMIKKALGIEETNPSNAAEGEER
jgi:voltage-gated potassium channel